MAVITLDRSPTPATRAKRKRPVPMRRARPPTPARRGSLAQRKRKPKTSTAAVILRGSLSASLARCKLQMPLTVAARAPITSRKASNSSSTQRTEKGSTRTMPMIRARPPKSQDSDMRAAIILGKAAY